LGKGIKRSAQLGMLAKDMAAARLARDDAAVAKAKAHLVDRLGALHGLPQKIGQILSLSELTKDEKAFTDLTEGPPFMPPQAAFGEIEDRLGRPLMDVFRYIDPQGISASLAQVHKAQLIDGREVAVKFQYPGVDAAVWSDLNALGWLTAPMGGLNKGFDLASYQGEVRSILEEELNYRHEADMLQSFAKSTASTDYLVMPKVIDELSTDTLLVMTWLEGENIDAARLWPRDARCALATAMVEFFVRSCLEWGFIHGDPHPGNYRFIRQDAKVQLGLLDFGCCKRLPPATVQAFRCLVSSVIAGTTRDNVDQILQWYLDAGFDKDLTAPMANHLPALTEALFEPFKEAGPYDAAQWGLSSQVSEILGDLRWNFRFAGPANLLVFIRAYQGLLQYLTALDAPVCWRTAFEAVTDEAAPTPAPKELPASDQGESWQSDHLIIRVNEEGRTKVKLTFRAHVTNNLADIIPDDVKEKLDDRKIDLQAIVRDAVASKLGPQELFCLDEGKKVVRVWLE
jgi:predicted unusual protein kinase regulating ubiquinone biosynthesis (AarF/ABC1/UbiB family)